MSATRKSTTSATGAKSTGSATATPAKKSASRSKKSESAAEAKVEKSKAKPARETLTPEEKAEQQKLRDEYRAEFKANLMGQLDNVYIQETDGTKRKITQKQ